MRSWRRRIRLRPGGLRDFSSVDRIIRGRVSRRWLITTLHSRSPARLFRSSRRVRARHPRPSGGLRTILGRPRIPTRSLFRGHAGRPITGAPHRPISSVVWRGFGWRSSVRRAGLHLIPRSIVESCAGSLRRFVLVGPRVRIRRVSSISLGAGGWGFHEVPGRCLRARARRLPRRETGVGRLPRGHIRPPVGRRGEVVEGGFRLGAIGVIFGA